MIALDIHRVKSMSAIASSHGPGNNWVKLYFNGPEGHFELIVFFEDNRRAAEAYAAAINGVTIGLIIPVDEQRAA